MEAVNYKCPGCGAPLSFDIDKQNWACKFCNAEYTLDRLKNKEDGTDSKEYAAGDKAAAYECPNCGARVITDKNTVATFCAYCHSPAIIASRLKGEKLPKYIIPFKFKKEAAIENVKKLCRRKPLLPKKFRDSVENGEVSGLYVPFWLFSSEMSARLDASAQNIMSWSDSKYRYTKTDTFAVVREADIAVGNIPADGSAKMDDSLMESMEPYDYSEIKDFTMEYVSGHFAESYDVDADSAEKRIIPRIRQGVEGLMRGQVSGYTAYQVKNLNINTRYLSHEYAMFPVWTLMHDFNGKKYYFAMNGQSGKVTGKLPIDWLKAAIFFAAGWLAAFGILMLVVML